MMVSTETFRKLAMGFPDITERPHFERTSFRTPKRIFATMLENEKTVNLKLSETEQSVFCLIDPVMIYRVPNKFGSQGWTTFELTRVKKNILLEALTAAFLFASR